MLKQETFFGFCPVFNQKAEVVVSFREYKNPKDIQATYTRSGFKCNQLPKYTTCPMINCPIIQGTL